jgi:broad specificity phosphatase PhoE
MKIYFVRHGKTNASTGDAISHDDPLNEEGMNQAREVASQLKDVHFDAIISSPLRRASQTADAINKHHGLSIIVDERWRERDLEKYMSIDAWNESFDFSNKASLDGVEPLANFFRRVYAAIDDLKQDYNSKTILVTSHGGVHHALYAYANKLPLEGNVRISRMAYCEYRIYEI